MYRLAVAALFACTAALAQNADALQGLHSHRGHRRGRNSLRVGMRCT